jgi:rhodanese-related sulfurtransferase
MKRTARHPGRGRAARWVLGPIVVVMALGALAGCTTVRNWAHRRQARRPPYKIVLPSVAYEIMRDNAGILILDLRTSQEFLGATGHLRNAINIPLASLPYRLVEMSSYRNESFLVYCDTTPCAEAGMAILLSSGFDDGILIQGGVDAWIRSGFKTFLPASEVGRVQQSRVPELSPNKPKELPVNPPPTNPPPDTPPPTSPPPPV